jgi:hypothetical protein
MAKRWYFVNKEIDDPALPFVIEITSGFTIYYRMREGRDKGVLRRADSMITPKTHQIVIDIEPFVITAKSLDKDGNVIYDIFKDGICIGAYEEKEDGKDEPK